MDVIFKEGMLYLQGFKFGKRIWRKIWMTLFKPSSTGVGRLEISNVLDTNPITDQKKAGRLRTSERKVVRLSDCVSVTHAPKESCPKGHTAFYLNTIQSTYTLASMMSQDWISALCLLAFQKDPGQSDKGVLERENAMTMEENDLYSSWKADRTISANQYQVTVQSTEASKRCKLAGEYLVSPEEGAVKLLDINTGHTIYRWPYRLLRKFGPVEGGFKIEAGRRCESGEGIFIFLSAHGPLIFQVILEQCSLARRASLQPPNDTRRSACDQPLATLPTTSNRGPGPTPYNPADVLPDIEDTHYATISEASVLDSTELPHLSNSIEALDVEDEDKDERCPSLEALKLEDDMEESIYYNLRQASPAVNRKDPFHGTDEAECVYADVNIHSSPSDQQLQPISLPPPPVLQQPSCATSQAVACSPLKPRHQRQPPVNNCPQTQAVDDMQETEEANCSSAGACPTEPPGTFKHRLAEIICKDLAYKFQAQLPPGTGSPAFPQ